MEDKELQELFAAKRTSEANRRRQEELRRMMETSASKKSLRLWPVWVGSAAAAVVLLLIALPTLFRQPETTPILMARNETLAPTPKEDTIAPKETPIEARPKKTKTIEKIEAIEKIEPEYYAEESKPEPETVIESHPMPIVETANETNLASNDEPRIHRRTSTSMVCSNCNINNMPSQSTTLQDFLAATFGAESNTPFTLKSIEF